MFEQTFKNIDDILHKDAGCTSELDYTEQSSWLLFLKYLDALEADKASEAALEGKPYRYIIEPAYRWETWAAPKGPDGKLDHDAALNYVHSAAIHRLTDGHVDCQTEGVDLDFVRMDAHFKELLSEALKAGGFKFHAKDLDGQLIPARKENAKRILNTYVMAAMTADEIKERSRYAADDGKECFEVLDWLEAIAARC
jgi:hypothetical protein